MKLLIIASVLGLAAAQYGNQYQQPAQSPDGNARIIRLDADVGEDKFSYNFETDNGIKAEEQGREADGIEAQGGFQYTGPDGQVYAVSYQAGQGGFQPQGAHFPTAPPTPEAILEALAKNAADEAAGIVDDGQYNPAKYGGGAAAPSGFGGQQQGFRSQASASANFRKPYNKY